MCRHFGLSTFRLIDVFVGRLSGLLTLLLLWVCRCFLFDEVFVCWRFGLWKFRFVNILVCGFFGLVFFCRPACHRFSRSTFWSFVHLSICRRFDRDRTQCHRPLILAAVNDICMWPKYPPVKGEHLVDLNVILITGPTHAKLVSLTSPCCSGWPAPMNTLKANNGPLGRVRWIQSSIKKWSCVNFLFQFHERIEHELIYMTHEPCYI